jgi:ATP-dependent protease HslVU (ClpYQ) peptidase subunit
MTTVAYRNGVLASDSLLTDGNTIISNNAINLWKLADGSLVSGSGTYEIILSFIAKYGTEELDDFDLKKTEILLIEPSGKIMIINKNGSYEIKEEYAAIGTGREIALGAMHAGADVIKAVASGIYHDPFSGGAIQKIGHKP